MENTQVGPFLILERLGTNRRQRVYRARQIEQDREVALKFIKIPPGFDLTLALEKVNFEFSVLRSLRHPHLVRNFGAGYDGKLLFLASELVEGESLSSILSRRGRIAPDQAVDYARQISLCLEYLHSKHLIHGKLTPDKILVAKDGTVRVTDLRLNRPKKRRWDSVKYRDAELAAYLAPEQLTGYATNKSDIYSLGTIMYEMLTGHLPFPPENIARSTRRKLEDNVESVATQVLNCPIWLDRLVMQMIDPTVRKRPHSAQAVRMALEEIARIDATSRSAIDENSGSINALNINADRVEARALLHKSTTRAPRKRWLGHFMVSGILAFLICIAVYALLPVSNERLFNLTEKLVASSDPTNWGKAREKLAILADRGLSNAESKRAENLMIRSRRKTLLTQAKRHDRNELQSSNVQAFISAFDLEVEKKFSEAYKAFQAILQKKVLGDDEKYVRLECEAAIERLEALKDVPYGAEALTSWIEKSRRITDSTMLQSLLQTLTALTEVLGKDPDYDSVCELAKVRIDEIHAANDAANNGLTAD